MMIFFVLNPGTNFARIEALRYYNFGWIYIRVYIVNRLIEFYK